MKNQIVTRDQCAGKYLVIQWREEMPEPDIRPTYLEENGDGVMSGKYVSATRTLAYTWGLGEPDPYVEWSDTAQATLKSAYVTAANQAPDEEVVP